MKKRTVALLCSCALLVGISVSGTMAWLTSAPASVENTFTVGDVEIDLWEHVYQHGSGLVDEDNYAEGQHLTKKNDGYIFVPGNTLPKDPFVTVHGDSEDCYLFIRVQEVNNTFDNEDTKQTDKIIIPTIDNTVWTQMGEGSEYYYYNGNGGTAKAEDRIFVLVDNQITINSAITKEQVNKTKNEKPQIIISAAAIQKDNLGSVEVAWSKLPSEFTGISVTADE